MHCPSVALHVWCISPIIFEVGIPNLVSGCILGWQSVTCHLCGVTVTLTSDLVLKVMCPEHISYIILDRNPKFGLWMHLGMVECRVPFTGHCDLDLLPSF